MQNVRFANLSMMGSPMDRVSTQNTWMSNHSVYELPIHKRQDESMVDGNFILGRRGRELGHRNALPYERVETFTSHQNEALFTSH